MHGWGGFVLQRAGRIAMLVRAKRSIFSTAVIFVVLAGAAGYGQVMGPPADASTPSGQLRREPEDPLTVQQKKELAKKQNELRQQEIKKDTDQLLELATELKQYVDKTNSDILSMDVIKKAEQIEKLAKAVREKMKGQ